MPYPPRFRVFASSRDLKDLCYWCGRASGRRVIGSCSVIVRLLWNSREHYSGIQDGWWINKYISWLFFKIQKCERKNIFIWWYLMPRGRCDPCQWSCRRSAYEDCIVIELNKPGSTGKKANPWRFVAERKNRSLLLASIRAVDRVLLSNTFDRVLDPLGPCYAAVVGCRWWVPPGNEQNSSGILCGLNMSF